MTNTFAKDTERRGGLFDDDLLRKVMIVFILLLRVSPMATIPSADSEEDK